MIPTHHPLSKRLFALLMLTALLIAPVSAIGDTSSEYYVMAHSNLYKEAFPVHLYCVNGTELYIDAVTLAGISGYSQLNEREFALGQRTISPSQWRKLGKTWCFPMETTLDAFGVRVWEKNGELYFLSGRDILQPLFEAMDELWLYQSLVDPDNPANFTGTVLSYVTELLVSLNFKPVQERYRNAMYQLIQEDLNEVTFATLQTQREEKIDKTLQSSLSFLELFMDESELNSFFAGSELMYMKDYLRGMEITEKTLGMPLSEYYRRLEEITLFFNTNVHAMCALEYIDTATPNNDVEKEIVKAAQEILYSAKMNTEGWGIEIIGKLTKEHISALFNATASNLLHEIMLGKSKALSSTLNLLLSRFTAVGSMNGLKDAYALAELQSFFQSQAIDAQRNKNWLKMKYMVLMYYRCFHASCTALYDVDMKDIEPNWKEQLIALQDKCTDQFFTVACVSDSELKAFMVCSDPIEPSFLSPCYGPEADYRQLTPTGSASVNAVQQGACKAWEEACIQYGQVPLSPFNGKLYMEPENGAAFPVLTTTRGKHILTILVQQDGTLFQIFYQIDDNGSYKQIFSDPTLTLGQRERLYLFAKTGTGLISQACFDPDITAYDASAQRIEKTYFPGDPYADSISAMGAAARQAFQVQYGDPEWTVLVDANYGMFELEIWDPENTQSIFGMNIP